jgi:hypothetical protein
MNQPATALGSEHLWSDFSLVRGGPFYHLWLRMGLAKEHLELQVRRTLFFVLVTWLPLLLLSSLYPERLATPFLADLDVQVRLLVALPIFLLGELYNGKHLNFVVRLFVDRNIVPLKSRSDFRGIITSTEKLRDSWIAEVIMLVAAFTLGIWLWGGNHPAINSTWYGDVSGGSFHYTPAGYWLVFVAVPLFQFVTLRWLWRIALWYQFLWRVNRLPLTLNLYHPDQSGGLGFVEKSALAFAPVLVPYSAIMAGMIGNRIWHTGARLADFRMDVAVLAVFEALLVLLPLTFFVKTLEGARWRASREFGTLASSYVDAFREKWIRDGLPQTDGLLGTADLQSLADLAHSFESTRGLRPVPISKSILITITAVIIGPMMPLAFTIMPAEQIIERVLKAVL